MITCHIFSDSFPENLSGTGLLQPRGFKWFAVCRTSHADVVSVFINILSQVISCRYEKMNILIKRFLNSKIPLRSTNFRADMQKMAFRKT